LAPERAAASSSVMSHQDNRQTHDSDTTEDPDQQSLANQMRAFQKSMLENQRTFQVTMTDTEKMTQMFSQLNRSTFLDNNTQHEIHNNSGQVDFQNNQCQNSQRARIFPDVILFSVFIVNQRN